MPCRVTPPWALVAQYAVASTIPPLSARPYTYWHKGAQTPGVSVQRSSQSPSYSLEAARPGGRAAARQVLEAAGGGAGGGIIDKK